MQIVCSTDRLNWDFFLILAIFYGKKERLRMNLTQQNKNLKIIKILTFVGSKHNNPN